MGYVKMLREVGLSVDEGHWDGSRGREGGLQAQTKNQRSQQTNKIPPNNKTKQKANKESFWLTISEASGQGQLFCCFGPEATQNLIRSGLSDTAYLVAARKQRDNDER